MIIIQTSDLEIRTQKDFELQYLVTLNSLVPHQPIITYILQYCKYFKLIFSHFNLNLLTQRTI